MHWEAYRRWFFKNISRTDNYLILSSICSPYNNVSYSANEINTYQIHWIYYICYVCLPVGLSSFNVLLIIKIYSPKKTFHQLRCLDEARDINTLGVLIPRQNSQSKFRMCIFPKKKVIVNSLAETSTKKLYKKILYMDSQLTIICALYTPDKIHVIGG